MTPLGFLLVGLLLIMAALAVGAYALDLVPAGRADLRRRVVARPGVATVASETSGFGATHRALGMWRGVVSSGALKAMERNLSIAGRPRDSLRTLLKVKVVAPVVVLILGSVFASASGQPMLWLGVAVGVIVAYKYPDIYCASRATERRDEMVSTLPDVLDQITIALDAGMSFEAAFARVGATHRGPIGPQIVRTVQDMAVGMPRREAYLALAERNDVADVTQLMRSLVQAEEFGVPIAQVVRLQADEMRDKRRQRAAAKAHTVPLKLLFPMMSCFLPVLFIILLTPAIINAVEVL